ncbi:hypothetical protein [Desulfonatronovibrio magnus]|uniref:hypothetical protein n=1 Tax=Desulfonatronovibrio magnus TaxID=698827 RepID=UPI0005EB46EF|nr:hypothetical protein [Desulfonatronovibrio magnus]
MHKNNKLAVIGFEEGLAGQVSGWVEESLGYDIVLYINPSDTPLNIDPVTAKKRPASQFDVPKSNSYKNKKLINKSDFAPFIITNNIHNVLIAISDNHKRKSIFEYLCLFKEISIISCIHPRAVVMHEAIIGSGVIIEPLCYIGYRAEINNCVHMRAGSHVEHHTVIESYVTIGPKSTIAGNSHVKSFSTLHTNCTIINRITVEENNIIGAGAAVINNISERDSMFVGVPAKLIKA